MQVRQRSWARLREDRPARIGARNLQILGDVNWRLTTSALLADGFVRVERALAGDICRDLAAAAPTTWEAEPDVIGTVRQRAMSTGLYFDRAAGPVRQVGSVICDSLSAAIPSDIVSPPLFNEVRWSKSEAGSGYSITAHRDPPLCGGVIAIVTLFGQAVFRVHRGAGKAEWKTADGDLVILRGNGWPTDSDTCPVHEAELPDTGERVILTFRHNAGGPGANYFTEIS